MQPRHKREDAHRIHHRTELRHVEHPDVKQVAVSCELRPVQAEIHVPSSYRRGLKYHGLGCLILWPYLKDRARILVIILAPTVRADGGRIRVVRMPKAQDDAFSSCPGGS